MSVLERRFVVVMGKGGVGKSTVSAALAMASARAGKRTLIAMCNSRHGLSQTLEAEAVGTEIREVLPNIHAVNMQPQAALEEYGMMILKVRALHRVVFRSRFTSAFLWGTPGLSAWAMLGKAQYHALEEHHGQRRFDLVIVDAPATGHGLDMLRVPRVIMDVAPPGLLRREAERAWGLFTDPERASICLVALPEDMAANETVELHETLRDELRLPVGPLVINRVAEPLFDDDEARLIEGMDCSGSSGELSSLCAAVRSRVRLQQAQQGCIQRLRDELPLGQVQLPDLFDTDLDRSSVDTLSRELQAGLERADAR